MAVTAVDPNAAVLKQQKPAQQEMGGPQVNPGVPQVNFGTAQPQTPQVGPGGAQVSAINPQSDLRGQQINPGNSARTTATQGLTNQAANQVAAGGYSPYSAYQATAAPYQQAGTTLFDQAAASGQQQTQYLNQAQNAVAGTGFGQYGAIQPTVSGPIAGGGSISAPQFSQGQLSLPGIQTGPLQGLQNLNLAGDTSALRGRVTEGVDSLYTAPDRGQLAADQFKLLQEQQAPILDQAVRKLGEGTAAFGRMGSGLVNSQLADLGTAFKTSADQNARQLALDAAGQTMSDRLGRLSATQSGLGQLSGLDTQLNDSANRNTLDTYDRGIQRDQLGNDLALNQAGFNLNRDQAMNDANFRSQSANASNALQAAGLNLDASRTAFDQQDRNRQFDFGADAARNDLAFRNADLFRGLGDDTLAGGRFSSGLADQAFNRGDRERDFLSQYETSANNYGLDRLGAMSGLEGQQFNQDSQFRDELRGERGYQNQLERDSYERARDQFLTEGDAYNTEFAQNQQRIGNLGNLGYGSDPTGALTNQAGYYQGQGNQAIDDAANALGGYFSRPQSQVPGVAPAESGYGPNINPPPGFPRRTSIDQYGFGR